MTHTEIRREALQMTREERASLAHDLILSIDPGEPAASQASIDAAWAAEAERRLDEYEKGGCKDSVDAYEHLGTLRREPKK